MKKIILSIGVVLVLASPIISASCVSTDENTAKANEIYTNKSGIFNSSQLEAIKNDFVFELTEQSKMLKNNYGNKALADELKKICKDYELQINLSPSENNKLAGLRLINNANFLKLFKVVKPNLGVNHQLIINFKIDNNNNISLIYDIYCKDVKTYDAKDQEIKLDLE